MATEKVTMYRVVCDRCGKSDETGDYSAYTDENSALEVALIGDFFEIIECDGKDKHACADCWQWSDDEEEIIFLPKISVPQGAGQ